MAVRSLSQHPDTYWTGLTPVRRVKNFPVCLRTPRPARISHVMLCLDSSQNCSCVKQTATSRIYFCSILCDSFGMQKAGKQPKMYLIVFNNVWTDYSFRIFVVEIKTRMSDQSHTHQLVVSLLSVQTVGTDVIILCSYTSGVD